MKTFIYPIKQKKFGCRRIRCNIWGNWYGYVGRNKVQSFFNNSFGTQEEHARAWLDSFKYF